MSDVGYMQPLTADERNRLSVLRNQQQLSPDEQAEMQALLDRENVPEDAPPHPSDPSQWNTDAEVPPAPPTGPLTPDEMARRDYLMGRSDLNDAERAELDALNARPRDPTTEYHARLASGINPPPEPSDVAPAQIGIFGIIEAVLAALTHLQQNVPGAYGLGTYLRNIGTHLHAMKLEAGDPAAKAVESAKAPPPDAPPAE